MAVITKAELMEKVKGVLSDNTTDEALDFLGDLSDTLDDYETKTKDNTDWHNKYVQVDTDWRNKFKERFFNTPVDDEKEKETEETDPDYSFSGLFTTEERK